MSWILLEYQCPACGERIESLERRSAPAATQPHCGRNAPRALSAPAFHAAIATVTRGKSGPPPPHAVDTRPLAEGMPLKEWRAQRRKKHRDARRAQIEANT